jgi:exodeoxyribonuclease V alpha subunit
VVERITFQNPENGFTVARLAPERRDDERVSSMDDERLITLVGTLPDLQPGEAIVAQGWWRNDPKHGWQFQAAEYRTMLPATVQGMKRYLGSGLVKGIGLRLAQDDRVHLRDLQSVLPSPNSRQPTFTRKSAGRWSPESRRPPG